MKEENISAYFEMASQIEIRIDGKISAYQKGDDKFEALLGAMLAVSKNSKQMPAYGVSLNNETQKAMTSGTWIEFQFDETKEFESMPFDALLISVNKDYTGFNLIRKLNKKYDGRCFYLRLEGDMSEIFDAILKISKN